MLMPILILMPIPIQALIPIRRQQPPRHRSAARRCNEDAAPSAARMRPQAQRGMVIVLAFERCEYRSAAPSAATTQPATAAHDGKERTKVRACSVPYPCSHPCHCFVVASIAAAAAAVFHHNSLPAARPAPVLEAALQAHAAALPPQVLSTRAHTPQPPPRHTPRRANAYAFALIIRQTKPQSVPAGERTTHPNHHHRTHPGAHTQAHSPSLYCFAMPGRRSRRAHPRTHVACWRYGTREAIEIVHSILFERIIALLLRQGHARPTKPQSAPPLARTFEPSIISV